MLVLVMGNTTLAASAILTAFMAGLSLGGVYWGRRVDKTSRSALLLFGCLEAGSGISALVVSKFIWLIVPLESYFPQIFDGGGFMQALIRFILCFCVLVVPTFLMGGTPAVIGKHMVSRGGRFGRHMAGLYGINTAGSFIGAFAAGFFLIRYFGHTGSLLTAAVLNCIVGIIAVWAGFRDKTPDTPRSILQSEETSPPTAEYRGLHGKTAHLVLIGLGISGFCAIVYQILWTRLLILIIDNSVYSFTIILMGFLAGIALGSLVAVGCFRYVKNMLLLFALVEICIGVTAFCFPFFVRLKPYTPELSYLKFLLTTLPIGLFLPTLFMGIAFPIGAEIYRRHRGDVGKSIGFVYAVNTAGCVLGGMMAGFFLSDFLDFKKVCSFCPDSTLVLFTHEFYRLVRSRLAENGIFLQWLPFHGLTTEQYLGIMRTFSSVFDHTSIWRVGQGYTLLLSSPQPLKIDFQSFLRKLAETKVQHDLRSAGLDNPFELLGFFAMGEETLRKMLAGSEMVMTDDSPAHLFFPFSATFKDQYNQWPLANYKKIKAFEESVVPFLYNISDSPVKRKQVENAVRYFEYRSGS